MLQEFNQYQDTLFPFEIYHVNKQSIIPKGRGFRDLHYHEELQITLILNGNVSFQIDGKNYDLRKDQAIFINSRLLHMASHMDQNGEYISFNFPKKFLYFYEQSRMQIKYVDHYLQHIDAFKITDETMIKHLLDIYSIYLKQDDGFEYEIMIHITSLWYLMIHNMTLCDTKNHDLTQNRMQTMLAYIYTHYDEVISLNDIATSAHISQSECQRCFRKYTLVSPYQFLIQYRLQRSIDLLLDTDQNITEISQKSGFLNVNQYIQSFKKHYHITPLQYRQTYKKIG